MTTACVTTKSSAVSVCILPGLEGRHSEAIFPSGCPVEKENEAAETRPTSRSNVNAATVALLAEKARPNCLSRRSQAQVRNHCIRSVIFIFIFLLGVAARRRRFVVLHFGPLSGEPVFVFCVLITTSLPQSKRQRTPL